MLFFKFSAISIRGFPKMVLKLTFVKVVDPEAMRICLTLLWNLFMESSSTLRKH